MVIFFIKIACPYKLFIITKIGFHLEIIGFHLETDSTFKKTFWTGLTLILYLTAEPQRTQRSLFFYIVVRGDNVKAKLSDINAIYTRYDNFNNDFLFVFRPLPAIASSGKAGGSQGLKVLLFLFFPTRLLNYSTISEDSPCLLIFLLRPLLPIPRSSAALD